MRSCHCRVNAVHFGPLAFPPATAAAAEDQAPARVPVAGRAEVGPLGKGTVRTLLEHLAAGPRPVELDDPEDLEAPEEPPVVAVDLGPAGHLPRGVRSEEVG